MSGSEDLFFPPPDSDIDGADLPALREALASLQADMAITLQSGYEPSKISLGIARRLEAKIMASRKSNQ